MLFCDQTIMKKTLILLSCFFSLNVFSQERIDSDRPDQTDGTHVIEPGSIQIEPDFYYNEFAEEDPAVINSTLLRIGILTRSELRIIVEEGIQRDIFISESTQGISPLSVGNKTTLLSNHKWLPDISLLASIQIPATSKSEENKMKWAPMAVIAFKRELKKFELDVNVGLKGNAFKDGYSWLGSNSFRYDFHEKFIGFVEYFGN